MDATIFVFYINGYLNLHFTISFDTGWQGYDAIVMYSYIGYIFLLLFYYSPFKGTSDWKDKTNKVE